MSSIYKLTTIQEKNLQELGTKRSNCNLFDPYTPFNCINCHKGYALEINSKSCVAVSSPINNCEEYISSTKVICIRCEAGYVLDYGINMDLFTKNSVLSNITLI